MKSKWTYFCLLVMLVFHASVKSQVIQSPLAEGFWVKFSVERNGIYKIDFNQLKSAGFDVDELDPRNISLFGNGTGMLPQPNSIARSNSLSEVAIKVRGEEDGVFNQSDYILFYGEGPDHFYYDTQKELFYYENNLYTEKNYYFMRVSPDRGLRISDTENIFGSFPSVTSFDDLIFHESESYNELKSGRKWFGEQFDSNPTLSLKFDVSGIVSASQLKIVSSVMAQSFSPASFNVSLNNILVKEQSIDPISNTQYGIKGRVRIDTISVNSDQVNSSSNSVQEFRYQYNKGSSGKSIGYLDFLLVTFERRLGVYGQQTSFSSSRSLSQPISTFEVISATNLHEIWDISDPHNVSNQQFQLNGDRAIFSTATQTLKTFVIFSDASALAPQFEGKVENQNLSSASAQLLIVTHPVLKNEAQRLASHRQAFNGVSTLVATTEEIYNEFSGGKPDPVAIRDFAKKLYNNGGLKNILLFGRSSYDYLNRVNKNTNLVPTYESRNSLSPLETYSSDDFFGFLELNEGDWLESPAENHTLDIGVGRLPAKTIEEATNIVDKLISYDLNPKAKGQWRKQILFVADDGDFNLHQSDADKLARNIESTQFQFDTQKLYLDAFKQISKPSGQVSPDARKALIADLKKGTLIVNFTGHGSEKVWVQEQILDEDLIEEWKNDIVYPLMVTATCEFGRHDDPAQISSSELALLKKKGGAIGFVTAARPVNASTNAFLNNAFYQALFTKENGKYRDLGTIFRDTKNNSINGVSNRNFSLLGDPSMLLAIPNYEVVATQIKTSNGSDTLKALSRIKIMGQIQSEGTIKNDFNGSVFVTLKDKEFSVETLGDENPVFTYKERSNTLFRGEATVKDGLFEAEFVLPKNIAYQVGSGKLGFYAKDKTTGVDAIGGSINFKIGESEADDGTDSTPPEIKLFIGDSTFRDGGIASPSTILYARLSDANGVNIANYGIGNNLIAILDNEQTFEVGEYFISDLDDFTKGTIQFPIEDLTPGKHIIELKAWDVYNNGASAIVNFIVTRENELIIEDLVNYPNPFSETTTFQFSHNRSGEDLDVFVSILDITGRPAMSATYLINESPYLVTLPQWDGTNVKGAKLDNGIYLLRVVVRSLLDGSKNERISKLIMLN